MPCKKHIIYINIIIFIIIFILSYIYLGYPLVKNCKDEYITKNATCHHEPICWNNDNCQVKEDRCPLKCNSIDRWVIIFLLILTVSSIVYFIILAIFGILNCIFKSILRNINSNINPTFYTKL